MNNNKKGGITPLHMFHVYLLLFLSAVLSDVPDGLLGDVPANALPAEGQKRFKKSEDAAFYRCGGHLITIIRTSAV